MKEKVKVKGDMFVHKGILEGIRVGYLGRERVIGGREGY